MDKWEDAKEELVVHQLTFWRQGEWMSDSQRPEIVPSTIAHILSDVAVMGGTIAASV
jgi:hypothetical protein